MSKTDEDLFIDRVRARLEKLDDVPAPPAAMQRWQRALDAAARPAPRPALVPGLRFAVAALVLAAGIGIAFLAFREDAGIAAPEGTVAAARFERALQWHLLELESQLAQAAGLPPLERAGTIRRLAQQNRVQTAVAERAGGGREARVLRAFTVALENMAADPHANGEFKGALAQLDFELKVMQARLASSSPSAGAGGLQAL